MNATNTRLGYFVSEEAEELIATNVRVGIPTTNAGDLGCGPFHPVFWTR